MVCDMDFVDCSKGEGINIGLWIKFEVGVGYKDVVDV